MELHDYLRDQSNHYRQVVELGEDLLTQKELLELLDLAATCDDVANEFEEHLTAG